MAQYLCRCNNCYTVMYDENPDSKVSRPFSNEDLEGLHIKEMDYFTEDGIEFLGCCICGTDDYLADITSKHMLAETLSHERLTDEA